MSGDRVDRTFRNGWRNGLFETAEVGARVPKLEYRARVTELRGSLLDAQQELRRVARFPVIVVLSGLEAAGRGETANLLNEWMDPRWIVTRAWQAPSDEERERPVFWRYWRALPPSGQVGLYLNTWYESPVGDRVERRCGKRAFDSRLERIAAFERALAADGAVIIKFWFHLAAETQRARLEAFERDPLRRWRVTEEQWRACRLHDRIRKAGERAIGVTSTAHAPWHIVEGADGRYRNLTVATYLRDAIRARLDQLRSAGARRVPRSPTDDDEITATLARATHRHGVLSTLDMTQTLGKKRFATALERQQGRLNQLQRVARAKGLSSVAVFEGWDAAGKGGAVRRVTAALDVRDYAVIPIGVPTDEEGAHHYLWRFWRHLSRAGRVTIFDRSWYGRVLVERVERLARPDEWARAYGEIRAFEEELVDHGIVVTKFWLHITKAEQLGRFRDRQRTPHKRWKITDDDWRNRRKWDAYERAVNEMVERTGTRRAPWVLVEANDKHFARIKVIKTLADRLARALARH